jgi:F0F1-type ATP synthase beta subunit
VVDIEFPQNAVPQVYDALKVVSEGKARVWCWKFSNRSAAASFVASPWVPPTVCVVGWK